MKYLVLILGFFIAFSCNKVDENKLIKNKKGEKITKKYSGKALAQTKYNIAKKELGKSFVMLEVGSDSCKSCKVMGKMLQEIKEDSPKFKVFFIDVGKERVAAKELKVRMIPTQIFYDKNAKEIFRHVGKFKNKDLLIKKLKSLGFDV